MGNRVGVEKFLHAGGRGAVGRGWLTGVVVALMLLGGCAAWRTRAGGELRLGTSEVKRALFVTKDRGIEMDVVKADAAWVTGKALRMWRVPEGSIDVDMASHSPTALARLLRWERLDVPPGPMRVKRADIRLVRLYEKNTAGRTTAIVLGVLAGVGALVGLGFLIFSAAFVACGRPLRVRGRQVITPVAKGAGWARPLKLAPVPAAARAVLIEVWTQEAQAEHAAVAAFSKLSLELLALGAPPELVVRASRAALQEVEHARLCFGLASAYSGQALAPAPLPEALVGDTADLFRLGRESLLDGSLREGVAAEIARLGAQQARDPEVARVLRLQAREEAQHADLGWAIVEWCLERGGEPMRQALLDALPRARMPRCDDLPEHGRVSRAVVEPHFRELRERARDRIVSFGLAAAA